MQKPRKLGRKKPDRKLSHSKPAHFPSLWCREGEREESGKGKASLSLLELIFLEPRVAIPPLEYMPLIWLETESYSKTWSPAAAPPVPLGILDASRRSLSAISKEEMTVNETFYNQKQKQRIQTLLRL